jgi:CheY-like chemotaxis protein
MTASSVSADHPRRHVVAIEPDPLLRALYRELLEEDGYCVTALPALDRQLDKVSALAPDVILIEDAPGTDGAWASLTALRQEPPIARVPIVLATAAIRQVEASADRLAALAVHVVVKPFNVDELGAVIAQALATSPNGALR